MEIFAIILIKDRKRLRTEKDRETNRQIKSDADSYRERHRVLRKRQKLLEIVSEIKRWRERDRDRYIDRDRQRQTETDRDRQRQTETDRDRQRQTETETRKRQKKIEKQKKNQKEIACVCVCVRESERVSSTS